MDFKEFYNVCMDYHFQKKQGEEFDSIIFAKKDQVFTLNFETSKISSLYRFKHSFIYQPFYMTMNDNQSIYMISSQEDSKYVSLGTPTKEISLSKEHNIKKVKAQLFDEEE